MSRSPSILCSIPTRGRYFTTLPMVLSAVINQTVHPDKIIIFDDNDTPKDMRKEPLYQHIFEIMNTKGIQWEWLFAGKKGQHHIHQTANLMGFEWVWRVDDDAVPEPNVLQKLFYHATLNNLGAVGGSILTSPIMNTKDSTGLIKHIDTEPNIQWGIIEKKTEVEHLHCSFLYRAGIHDYNLGLSRVAHREETLFTFGLHQKGYDILVIPDAVTWHMKNPEGGIREGSNKEMFYHDEMIFRNFVNNKNKKIIVLDSGMGDHIVANRVIKEIEGEKLIFSCYPDIVPGRSIAEAQQMFGDIDQWNIYRKMDQWRWTDTLENAYRKLYL